MMVPVFWLRCFLLALIAFKRMLLALALIDSIL
jgi:hypothetical protein